NGRDQSQHYVSCSRSSFAGDVSGPPEIDRNDLCHPVRQGSPATKFERDTRCAPERSSEAKSPETPITIVRRAGYSRCLWPQRKGSDRARTLDPRQDRKDREPGHPLSPCRPPARASL